MMKNQIYIYLSTNCKKANPYTQTHTQTNLNLINILSSEKKIKPKIMDRQSGGISLSSAYDRRMEIYDSPEMTMPHFTNE